MKITAYSESVNKEEFEKEFSNLQAELRQKPYNLANYDASIWLRFLKMPTPFKKEFWLLYDKNGRAVGRVGASTMTSYPASGSLGFFEVDVRDGQAKEYAQLLLQTAQNWLLEQSITKIYGPLNFNTWFSYRFQKVKSEQKHMYLWEPINPPEYSQYFEDFSFTKADSYHSSVVEGLDLLCSKMKISHDKALTNGYSFKSFSKDQNEFIQNEVPKIYEMTIASFKKNFLFEPIDLESFKALYVPVMSKFSLEYSFFALSPEGQEVAFLFAFLDPISKQLVLKSTAVKTEHRGRGLCNALVYLAGQAALKVDCDTYIPALIRDGIQTESYAKKAKLVERHEYCLYEKSLA